MAVNPDLSYGRDIRCVNDADELWSEVTGLELIFQDTIHVITCEDFLGPRGNKRGFDTRKLIGKKQAELTQYGPTISEAITRDPRVQTADVILTETKNARGLLDVQITINCTTALGPFSIISLVSELTEAQLEGTT